MVDDVIYVDENNNQIAPPNMGGHSSSGNYPPVAGVRGEKADLLDKIKPDLIVEVIRHRLMGEELINGKWTKVENLQRRSITRAGAWDISNLMLSVSSQNVSLSKLDDKTIRRRALSVANTAQEMALRNWKEYGIKGIDQLGFIHEIVFSNSLITLKQPEGEGIRKLLQGTTSESRIVNTTESPKQRRGWTPFRR